MLLLLSLLHDFSVPLGIFILSGCTVNGSAGDGSMQGTCSDVDQKCKDDGTCRAYYYHYYDVKIGFRNKVYPPKRFILIT